jgi:hypothetical protein
MSSNNSPEIVTQKELEPVLQNKAFDAKKFLELYEEWKQTYDTHTFALLRWMHEDAGYNNKNIIFGAEKEMHEIATIIKKFQEEKWQIMAVATSGAALLAAGNPPIPSATIPADSSHIETEYKYELKKYAWYALRELTKNGKTINDLQEKLKEKKFYSGEITGKFDEATLEAVFAFQKTMKHPVYGKKWIDGLVGSVETIPALFGIVSKPNTGTTTVPKAGTQKTWGTDSWNSTGPSPKKVPSPDVVTEGFLKTEQKIVFKDGTYYLTGPKGAPRKIEMQQLLVNLNLPKNAPENLSTSVAIIDDFSLVLDAYIRKNPKEKAKYDTAIQATQKLFADSGIQTGKKIIDITTITQDLFSNSRILPGDTDLRAINSAFRITNTKDRHLAVLHFVRDRLDQSDIVLEKLMQSNKDYFAFPKDEEILKIWDLSAAGLSLGARQKVEDAIRKARVDAASNWNKNHKEYLDQYKKQNPGTHVDEETARVWNEKLLILSMAKREIMYQKLYNNTDLTKEQTLMQDIMGAGSMKMSDRSWEVSQEVAGFIAMEAIAIAAWVVTAGTATVVINAAMLGRNAYRGVRAIEAYNAASKTRQVLTTSARILGSGAGFEAGWATMRSYIENGDFTSMHSKEWYTQSIAMMGVMSGIGKLITTGKLGKGIQFTEGAGMAKNIVPFVGQTVIEWSAIFGTSAAIGSVVFDRRDNWTMEQMAQAMLMATIFKWAGRVLARKGPSGEPEVHTESTARAHQEPVQTQRGWVAAVESTVLNTGNTLKTVKDYHLNGNALYERVTKLWGSKKIEIEWLPGYTIGMTADGRKLEIFGPKWGVFRFYKDQLERNLEGIYNLQKKANPTIDIPAQPTESVAPTNNWASSYGVHPIPEAVVPVAPHIIEQWANAQRVISSTLLNNQIGKSLKWLHKDGDSIVLWDFTISKEWKSFRVKWPEGEFVGKSQKDIVAMVESHFQKNYPAAEAYIGSQIKAHVDTLPVWKKMKYEDVTITKWQNGALEVVWKDGKVLSWEVLNNFYASNGEKILNSKMQSFLNTYWNKKISETDKIFWISTTHLFENKGKLYNPLTWAKGIGNMTWNELMQPVQTWNAFLGKWWALRTKDSPLAMANNITKAVVLRDVNMNWKSGDAAMRILGRWTIMTGATAAAGNDIFGNNLPAQVASVPMILGYSFASWDNKHTPDEISTTAYSTYYTGMIWWNLLSQAMGGMPNK